MTLITWHQVQWVLTVWNSCTEQICSQKVFKIELKVIRTFLQPPLILAPRLVPAKQNLVFKLLWTSASKGVPKAAPGALERHATVRHQSLFSDEPTPLVKNTNIFPPSLVLSRSCSKSLPSSVYLIKVRNSITVHTLDLAFHLYLLYH